MSLKFYSIVCIRSSKDASEVTPVFLEYASKKANYQNPVVLSKLLVTPCISAKVSSTEDQMRSSLDCLNPGVNKTILPLRSSN